MQLFAGDSRSMVLREITTSSSSDSLFTDPLTPLGFAAEFNQCYYSDENVYDLDSPSSLAGCNPIDADRLNVLAKLSISTIDWFDTTLTTMNGGGGGLDVRSPMLASTQIRRCSAPTTAGGGGSVFSVARFKKIELPTIQVSREPRPGEIDLLLLTTF